jgi:subtilase family serine protease
MTCYTPHQLQVAYGIRPLLAHGINGGGETVVLPELAEPHLAPPAVSDLRQDLAQFDQLFGLPTARLRVVTRLAGAAAPWLANGEEVLDVEMAHVVAPEATLAVVLVKTTALNSTASAVTAAVAALRIGLTQGGVISISAAGQAGGEHCDTPAHVARLHAALRAAASHHVTVVAASGDVGVVGEPCSLIKALTGGTFTPVKEANLPASDPLVLAAGGTSLTASHKTGTYISEGGGKISIRNSGGTSASAPIWAGIIALADQYAGRHLGFVNPALYRIARGPRNHQAFHDITTGSNTAKFPPKTFQGYRAAPGWDPVTGWGSPNARVLIPLLARH